MTAPAPRRRGQPLVVTIAVVLVYVSGLLSTLVGVLVLLSRYQVPDDDVLAVSLLGAGIILLGLLTIAVASALTRGSRLARLSLSVYLVVQVGLQIVTIITTDDWDWTEIAQIVIEVLVLLAVWAPPGSRHFDRPVAATETPAP